MTNSASGLMGRVQGINAMIGRMVPGDIVALFARIFVGVVFWKSARTKVDGFAIADSTYFLFEHEYALPIIPSNLAAVLATLAEHGLSVLLILGLLSRVSATGLLVMTAVIQFLVYPHIWGTHGLWAASLLAVMAYGPGRISVDYVLKLDR